MNGTLIFDHDVWGSSDWHLSDGTGPSTINLPILHNFLDEVGENDLILTGDILDLWRWKAASILEGPAKSLIIRLRDKENVWITLGNHDLELEVMKMIFQDKIVLAKNVNGYLCFHGHQLDARLDTPKERRFVKELSLFIQKVNIDLLNRFRDWVTSGPTSNNSYRMKFQGINIAMGHTHRKELAKNYVNPGSCVHDDCAYWIIDRSGVATLHKMGG